MFLISDKSEASSIVLSDSETDEKDIKQKKTWNRNDYFDKLGDKLKCKTCDQTYNLRISENILKSHYVKSHQSIRGEKITQFLVRKTDDNFRKNLIRFIVNGGHAF